jgi:hypothetical protein
MSRTVVDCYKVVRKKPKWIGEAFMDDDGKIGDVYYDRNGREHPLDKKKTRCIA